MHFANTLRVALRALRRNTLRSLLTALGMIIGVAAVITMVSIGSGAKAQVEAQVASLGQNLITVMPGSFSSGGMRGGFGSSASLTPEDADAIAAEVANIDGLSAEVRDRNQVLANGLNWNTNVNGVGPDYPYVRNWPMESGAMFTEQDVKSLGKVCVIGKTVADQMFPNEDPVGQTLRIRNLPFRILGVLSSKGFSIFGSDEDDVVLIPYTSHMRRVSRRTSISMIRIQAADADKVAEVKQSVEDLLTQRRRGREPDFTVRTQEELASAATATAKTMTGLLAGIAGVSLIVGGIGIMNIMLVSVTERTREIGIRLAIGAHGKDVLTQFLIEAILLSSLGGLVGVAVGVAGSQALSSYNGWPVLVPTTWIFISVAGSALVGIISGFYPAYKAAQLDPIDALRYE
ncbi:MAG: FtsX-like permease family protein [Verrucomicrobia bacterium]|nr:FtsX-like permease family protein [Verrucomicrobiota bacterium]